MSDTDLEPVEFFEIAPDGADDPEPLDLDPVAVNRKLKAHGHQTRRLNEYDAAAEDEMREQNERHEQERLELEDRLTRGRAPLAASVDHLAAMLELTGLARLEADPGAGTWVLPAGRLVVGGGGVEWVWPDGSDLLAVAKTFAPDAVTPQPAKVDKAKVKAALKPYAVETEYGRQVPASDDGGVRVDGLLIPGIKVHAKPRTVTPEPDLDAL